MEACSRTFGSEGEAISKLGNSVDTVRQAKEGWPRGWLLRTAGVPRRNNVLDRNIVRPDDATIRYPALRKMLATLQLEVESLRKENSTLILENQSLKRQLANVNKPDVVQQNVEAVKHKTPVPHVPATDYEAFQVGYRGAKTATVIQVVDDSNMVVEMNWTIERLVPNLAHLAERSTPQRLDNLGVERERK